MPSKSVANDAGGRLETGYFCKVWSGGKVYEAVEKETEYTLPCVLAVHHRTSVYSFTSLTQVFAGGREYFNIGYVLGSIVSF